MGRKTIKQCCRQSFIRFLRRLRCWRDASVSGHYPGRHTTKIGYDIQTVATQSAPITALPNELLQMVLDYLDLPAETSLSLSCKLLHSIMAPGLSLGSMSTSDRHRLLRLLERDKPELFLCVQCQKLFHWEALRHRGPKRRFMCPRMPVHTLLADVPSVIYGQDSRTGYALSAETRDVLLRSAELRHAKYDALVADLWSQVSRKYRIRGRWVDARGSPVAMTVRALDVSGSLLVRCERVYDFKHRSSGVWVPPIGKLDLSSNSGLCLRAAPGVFNAISCALSHALADAIEAASFHNTVPGPGHPRQAFPCEAMLHCASCNTDVLITTGQLDNINGHIRVWVSSWQNFGKRGDTGRFCFYGPMLDTQAMLDAQYRTLALSFRDAMALKSMDQAVDRGSAYDEPRFAKEVEDSLDLASTITESSTIQDWLTLRNCAYMPRATTIQQASCLVDEDKKRQAG